MKVNRVYSWYLVLLLFATYGYIVGENSPRLVVVFVVDQLPYRIIEKHRSYFKGAFKFFLEHGVQYTNAYYPHGMPATATGHAALNTGCCAKDHGIIGNAWFDHKGNKVYCDDDTSGNAVVFGHEDKGRDSVGKSSRNLLVDGISDSMILTSRPDRKKHVFALSHKSRAAINLAGKLGKAVWFDYDTGCFTTSKAYYQVMPDWLMKFNKQYPLQQKDIVHWKRMFPNDHAAYSFYDAHNYAFSEFNHSFVGKKLSVWKQGKKSYKPFTLTPEANQKLLNLAELCVDTHLKRKEEMLLWISLSCTDKVGHRFGVQSLEYMDILYHLDAQIRTFMRRMERIVKSSDILFVLTTDHGCAPIPELSKKRGMMHAHRIPAQELVKKMNSLIKNKYGIDKLVYGFKSPQFYLDEKKLDERSPREQRSVLADLKIVLMSTPGIVKVWLREELEHENVCCNTIEAYFKDQLFEGRSGKLVIKTAPYSLATTYPKGTSHHSPYGYDTHVPLILYQYKRFERQLVHKRTSMLQLPNSLAQIMHIPGPSASVENVLPQLFSPEPGIV